MAEWLNGPKITRQRSKVKRQKEENRAKDFSPLPITRHPSSIPHSPFSPSCSLLLPTKNQELRTQNYSSYQSPPLSSHLSTLDSLLSLSPLRPSGLRFPASPLFSSLVSQLSSLDSGLQPPASLLPTPYSPLPTTYYLLPTTYSPLFKYSPEAI